MRFFQAIFLGVFLLPRAEGKEAFHVKGPFDLDKDKASECLILNSKDHSILFVEINFSGENDTLWSYKFENEISIADGNFIDLDNDGNIDAVSFSVYGNVDGWADLLWPHRWALYTQDVYINGARVNDYSFELTESSYFTAGVLCHEFFHVLGAFDGTHTESIF